MIGITDHGTKELCESHLHMRFELPRRVANHRHGVVTPAHVGDGRYTANNEDAQTSYYYVILAIAKSWDSLCGHG